MKAMIPVLEICLFKLVNSIAFVKVFPSCLGLKLAVLFMDLSADNFSIIVFIVWSVSCQKIAKNAYIYYDLTHLTYLFCPTSDPSPKDIQFTISKGLESQQVFTFERIEQVI